MAEEKREIQVSVEGHRGIRRETEDMRKSEIFLEGKRENFTERQMSLQKANIQKDKERERSRGGDAEERNTGLSRFVSSRNDVETCALKRDRETRLQP